MAHSRVAAIVFVAHSRVAAVVAHSRVGIVVVAHSRVVAVVVAHSERMESNAFIFPLNVPAQLCSL